ncbi:MAG: vWA domain-containing protein [Planctomycetota bacterium]
MEIRPQPSRQGAVLPLIAITLPMILILAAFVVNLAYIELSQTEIQIAVDLSSRATGRTLIESRDTSQAIAKGQEIAELNDVAGSPMLLANSDFEFGISIRSATEDKFDFTPSASQINAVRITAQRTEGSRGGAIGLLFPSFLSRNQFGVNAVATSTQILMDISIVIDRSGSMAYADNENSNTFANPAAAPPGWNFGDEVPSPSRWRDAENAVRFFLNNLQNTPQQEFVSLVTYGDSATLDVPLTTNYTAINNGMVARSLRFPEARTNIGDGISVGNNSVRLDPLARGFATKVILVLTDGIHNRGTDPEQAARNAAGDDTTIFTITFSNEADQSRMRRVAEIGNGKHFHAASAAQLVQAFEEIAKSLPTLLVE